MITHTYREDRFGVPHVTARFEVDGVPGSVSIEARIYDAAYGREMLEQEVEATIQQLQGRAQPPRYDRFAELR